MREVRAVNRRIPLVRVNFTIFFIDLRSSEVGDHLDYAVTFQRSRIIIETEMRTTRALSVKPQMRTWPFTLVMGVDLTRFVGLPLS